MIYKNISQGIIEDVDDVKGLVTGYFSAFNNIDSDGDVIVSGAYKKSVAENGPMGRNRIMHLLQHNPLMPLAKPMELMEDAKGLRFTSKITETSYGKDVIKLYAEGVFNEHSVGFEIIKADNKSGYREIREIKLWEGSTVTWGANPNTPIESMKSWDQPKSEEMIAKFCGILRNGNLTDESMIQLEIGLKQIQEHLKALQTKSVQSVESEATQFESELDPTLAMALEFEFIPKLKKFI
jgi:HK97 family phage prohead protease